MAQKDARCVPGALTLPLWLGACGGKIFGLIYELMWKEGMLKLGYLNTLKTALAEMGNAHKACGLGVTLWAHLWVDHMGGRSNAQITLLSSWTHWVRWCVGPWVVSQHLGIPGGHN